MIRFALMTAAALPLAACANAGGEGPGTPGATMKGPCRNDQLTRFTGQTVTGELGADILKASGARTLRWGGPGMPMTMDFRPDRVTVSYDEQRVVTAARCG